MSSPTSRSMDLVVELTGDPAPKAKLLIVDDQPINSQILHHALSGDHQVLVATSGEQALELCTSDRPDLILLDVSMPGMDGFEVCTRLKADPTTCNIPVIIVSAHNDVAAETHGLGVGAVDYIFKPINPIIVRARVKAHIALKLQSDLLRSWAYMDGLTGVHNRRHFDEQLASEWARAVRNNSVMSVILLDVDFFKRYNDRYGHQAGDACLRRVAFAIKANLRRPADQVARYGGEEFVCMLPDTDLAAATQVAQAIRQAVFAMQIEHADSVTSPVVTVSLGVCSKSSAALGSEQALVKIADEQLYLAKSNGRNRVCGREL